MSFNNVFRNICYYWNVLEYLLSDTFGLLGWYTYSWTLLVLKLPTVVLGLKMLKNAWDLSYLNIKGLGHIMAILHSRGDRGCPIRSGGPIIWHFVEPKKRRETRESQLSTCFRQCCLWLLPMWLGSDRSDCLYNLQGPILHGHHDSLASRDMGTSIAPPIWRWVQISYKNHGINRQHLWVPGSWTLTRTNHWVSRACQETHASDCPNPLGKEAQAMKPQPQKRWRTLTIKHVQCFFSYWFILAFFMWVS